MILQRDPRMREEIKKNGCYLMSLLYLANKLANVPLSAELIAGDLFDVFVSSGWMTDECYVLNPDRILRYFGVEAEYTGTHEKPERLCAHDEVEILFFRHPTAGGHFVVGDGAGHVAYDPWGVSRSATEGTLESKRIFRVRSVEGAKA